MKGTFFNHLDWKTLDAWKRVLAFQATFFGPREMEVLLRYGFGKKPGAVLDLGCGPGYYTRLIRQRLPEHKIVATDMNAQLLEEVQQDLSPIQVLQWEAGKDPIPSPLLGCDSVVMRLFLQHVPDPAQVLRTLKESLRPGTRLYIVEEDDDFFHFDPPSKHFLRIKKAWRDHGENHANHRFIGKTIPRLFSESGIQPIAVELLSQTQFTIGLNNLLDYFLATLELIHAANNDLISREEIREIEKYFQTAPLTEQTCYVAYPQVIAIGDL